MSIGYWNEALACHRAGRLDEAVALYDLALLAAPTDDPLALYYAGMANFSSGRLQTAEALLRRATTLAPRHAETRSAHANVLHEMKRYDDAVAAFRVSIALSPADAALRFNFGNAARAAGLNRDAADAYRAALNLDPTLFQALPALAAALATIQAGAEAAALLDETFRLRLWQSEFVVVARRLLNVPEIETTLRSLQRDHASDGRIAWMLAGRALTRKDRKLAEASYRQAVSLSPQPGDPALELGLLLALQGRDGEAIEILRRCFETDGSGGKLLEAIRFVLGASQGYAESCRLFETAQQVYPDSEPLLRLYLFLALGEEDSPRIIALLQRLVAPIGLPAQVTDEQTLTILYLTWLAHQPGAGSRPCLMLGNLYANRGQTAQALEILRRGTMLTPEDAVSWLRLAEMTHQTVGAAEAEAVLRDGLTWNPRAPELLTYLGSLMMHQGAFDEACRLHDEARLSIGPGEGELFKQQLLFSNYRADLAPEEVSAMHFAWGNAFAARLARYTHATQPPHEKKTRLKIGYVSCDYKEASPAYFFKPLLFAHDRARVEVYCYMTTSEHDETTQYFRDHVPHWRMLEQTGDAEAEAMIRQDGIDILVDLAGHTLEPRFALFVRKPAPLQVTWLGYPNTTGLPTIDYRLTDARADPPGATEHLHSETLYRLPSFLCYQPPDHTPEVGRSPAAANRYVTFGCFNNTNKIVDDVVDVWVEILRAVEGSRLILKAAELKHGTTMDGFMRKFLERGISADRLSCFPQFPKKFDHLQTYGEVDMALDPFPYNGTTTTMECLWMGVPVVTLKGSIHAARVGYSILGAVGLDELVAETAEDYVQVAVKLASDPARLQAYRATLRPRLRASPLMDARGFARSVEDAYLDMWNRAVETGKTGS